MICCTMCFNRFVWTLEKRHGWTFSKWIAQLFARKCVWTDLETSGSAFSSFPICSPAINNRQRSQENVRTFKSILVAIYKRVIICLWTLHICSSFGFLCSGESQQCWGDRLTRFYVDFFIKYSFCPVCLLLWGWPDGRLILLRFCPIFQFASRRSSDTDAFR